MELRLEFTYGSHRIEKALLVFSELEGASDCFGQTWRHGVGMEHVCVSDKHRSEASREILKCELTLLLRLDRLI